MHGLKAARKVKYSQVFRNIKISKTNGKLKIFRKYHASARPLARRQIVPAALGLC
jgi:hypothetical protein